MLRWLLNHLLRCFCGNVLPGQKPSSSSVELSLVIFTAHGSYCGSLVTRSGWTKNVDTFLQWLSAILFGGGGFNDAAIAEGLSEALMMFPIAANGNQFQQNANGQRHCILVAASNPYPLPTPVYRPQMQNWEQSQNIEAQTESPLSDAVTVAKTFAQCSVSLSVICPRQLPKLRAIYDAGKRNPWAADPAVDNVKNPHFLVLISDNFIEACAALSRPGVTSLASNQSPLEMGIASVPAVTGLPPTSMPSAPGMSQENLSGAQMVRSGMNQSMMSGLGPSGVPSRTGTMVLTPRMPQQVQSGMQSLGVNNNSAANLPLSQRTSSILQSALSNYVKVWEGNLSGDKRGQSVYITRIDGYRCFSTSSERLAANWPQTMQIVRLISQDHMHNRENVRKADLLVFHALTQHGFLECLQKNKLCAVIELPSQTLLLSGSDKARRMIGMLFPGDMVEFKQQIPRQRQQQQHLQLQQQHHQQMQSRQRPKQISSQQQEQQHQQMQSQQHPQQISSQQHEQQQLQQPKHQQMQSRQRPQQISSQWKEQQQLQLQQQQHLQMQSQQHSQLPRYIEISDDENTDFDTTDATAPDEDLASAIRLMCEEALPLRYIKIPHDNSSKMLLDFVERFVKKFHRI